MRVCLALGIFAILPITAIATAESKAPDPADANALAPSASYESELSTYRPDREEKPGAWKEINEAVAGSVHGHARKADPPSGMPTASPDHPHPTIKPEASGHRPHSTAKSEASGHRPHSTAKSEASSHQPHPTEKPGTPGHRAHSTTKSAAAAVTGTGIVRSIDKGGGKVRLTHDPIDILRWPRMTLSFRLKERHLADRVKEGDRIQFSLDKSAAGYVISDLRKSG